MAFEEPSMKEHCSRKLTGGIAMTRKVSVLLLIAVLMVSVTSLYAAGGKDVSTDTGRVVNAKLASEEIEGDFMTVWAKNFAD